jgi:UDP-glucose 4-epimerase
MKILVTGAAGFIGSHVAEVLDDHGHKVVGIDNYLTGRPDNFPECRFADVRHNMEPLGKKWDCIVHCAASYSDGSKWLRDIDTNVRGAAQVCRLNPKRIVYFQTALCYGHDPYHGAPPYPLPLTTRIAPDNSYAISKTAAEQYIANSGITYVSLRLANIYGPRNLSGPIPTFYKRITDGNKCIVTDSRRDFISIYDLLKAAIPIIEGDGDGVYHVSTGRDYAISEAFEAVAAAMGVEVTPDMVEFIGRPPGDSPSILLDPSRLEKELGWKAMAYLPNGIRGAVDWYASNGVEHTFTHLQMDRA